MIGRVKRKLSQVSYCMKLRKELQQIDSDLLRLTYEEAKKEIERRNKKK